MTLQDLVTKLKAIWHSTPLAVILPVAALGYYWQTHGHKLPTLDEWIAGTALLATQADRIVGVFTKPAAKNVAGPGAILILGLSLGVTSCKTVNVPDAGTVVTIAETCAVKATHDVAVSIIGDVNTALAAASGWEAALADLAVKWGLDAVKCAVAEVTNSSNAKAMESHDPLESLKAERGKAYLAAH